MVRRSWCVCLRGSRIWGREGPIRSRYWPTARRKQTERCHHDADALTPAAGRRIYPPRALPHCVMNQPARGKRRRARPAPHGTFATLSAPPLVSENCCAAQDAATPRPGVPVMAPRTIPRTPSRRHSPLMPPGQSARRPRRGCCSDGVVLASRCSLCSTTNNNHTPQSPRCRRLWADKAWARTMHARRASQRGGHTRGA